MTSGARVMASQGWFPLHPKTWLQIWPLPRLLRLPLTQGPPPQGLDNGPVSVETRMEDKANVNWTKTYILYRSGSSSKLCKTNSLLH